MIRRLIGRVARRYIRTVHGLRSRYRHDRAPNRDGEWYDEPIYGPHVLEGEPTARSREFGAADDGGMSFGAWDCTAGRFTWVYDCDEVISILEGEAFLKIEGATEHLVAGSVFYFPLGTVAEWHVPEYVRKHYVLRHPAPLVRKLT